MRIATWNINGFNARRDALSAWLAATTPDVACLQEIKCETAKFDAAAFESLGYNVAVSGQKSFNGVAILSKRPIEDVVDALPGDDDDSQARYLEAVVSVEGGGAVRIVDIYLPNGNPQPGPKFDYKLAWMDRLADRLDRLRGHEEPLIVCGDYNVIPMPEDARRPEVWGDDALFQPGSRARFHALRHSGLTDVFRACHPDDEAYSFWDYQAGAWQKNNGIRIDFLLASPQAVDRLEASGIDRSVRGWEKPSDHVPIWAEFSFNT